MSEWQADNVEFVGSFLRLMTFTHNTLSDNGLILTVWKFIILQLIKQT
jgi:hypothetical protein